MAMKKILLALSLVIPFVLFAAVHASADPRMETNNNFCHFILNPDNTDIEIFMAGCNSEITVSEKVPTSGASQPSCENYTASGYARIEKVIPQSAISIPAGSSLTFTNNDSSTPCTMVESNGREYRSYNWQSIIRVKKAQQQNSYVIVQYELFCQDGEI